MTTPPLTLVAWTSSGVDGGYRAERALAHAAVDVTVGDGAVVAWPSTRAKPLVRDLQSVARTATVATAFWGMLLGSVFFVPELVALGGSLGGNGEFADDAGPLRAVGVSDAFVANVRHTVVPGTSALLVLVTESQDAQVATVLGPWAAGRIDVSLSELQTSVLRRVFHDS